MSAHISGVSSRDSATSSIPALNTEEISASVRDWWLLSRLLRLLAPYWLGLLGSFLCSIGSTLLQVINPLIISIAIDVYFVHRAPKLPLLSGHLPASSEKGILFLSTLYLVGITLNLVVDSTQNYVAQWTGQMEIGRAHV